MTLAVKLEKLRFLTMEMRLAMRMAQFAPTDADARMLARHVLVRAEDFITHARQLRRPLRQAGFDTVAFHSLKEYYAKEFEAYFRRVRDRLSAHVQDLDFGERIELWNGVDASKSEFFADGAAEIYRSLEGLGIPDFPVSADFPELDDPAFDEALAAYRASGSKVLTVEMGVDPLAMTRPNASALISTSPLQARAGQLALIQRWMMAHARLIPQFKAFSNAARVLKARVITDLVSACDCLITRDVDPTAPQHMDGLDVLMTADGLSPNAIEQFKATFRVGEAIAPYRIVRNKIGGHFDERAGATLDALLKTLDDADFEAGLGLYDRLRGVFEKACRDHLYLRAYLADGQTLYGVLGTQKGTQTTPFSEQDLPGRIVPAPDIMADTDAAYAAKLEEWFTGDSSTQGRARSAFWKAFLNSPVIEEYKSVERLPGGGEWHKTHSLRLAHRFILHMLEAETDPRRILGILELMRQCCTGSPDELTEILLRFTSSPKSAPYLSAIALSLGDLAPWGDLRVRACLTAGLNSRTTLAVQTRIALLRIFVRSEGVAQINGKPPTEAFSSMLATLTRGFGPEAKLMTDIFLASQFCEQRVAQFMRPFEQDYADLRTDLVALVEALTHPSDAARVSEMVRRLADTHDYPGICLYLYDELKDGRLKPLVEELAQMACDGVVVAAFHDQSRKHLCGCFLRLERYQEALGAAENLALLNPDSPDFQILLAEVMTCLPERSEEARNLAREIERRYKLSDEELARVEAIKAEANDPEEDGV